MAPILGEMNGTLAIYCWNFGPLKAKISECVRLFSLNWIEWEDSVRSPFRWSLTGPAVGSQKFTWKQNNVLQLWLFSLRKELKILRENKVPTPNSSGYSIRGRWWNYNQIASDHDGFWRTFVKFELDPIILKPDWIRMNCDLVMDPKNP